MEIAKQLKQIPRALILLILSACNPNIQSGDNLTLRAQSRYHCPKDGNRNPRLTTNAENESFGQPDGSTVKCLDKDDNNLLDTVVVSRKSTKMICYTLVEVDGCEID